MKGIDESEKNIFKKSWILFPWINITKIYFKLILLETKVIKKKIM